MKMVTAEQIIMQEKYSSITNLVEVCNAMDELVQVREIMSKSYVFRDNRKIDVSEWIEYNDRYQEWLLKDYPDDFSCAMSEPNHPNYFKANNE